MPRSAVGRPAVTQPKPPVGMYITAVRSLSTTRSGSGTPSSASLTGGVEAEGPGERVRASPVLGGQGEDHVEAHARTDLAVRPDSSVRMSG